ncbi:MAG: response regulator [Nitrospira sp.]|nr:response regulator [Nitrospira sp.]MCA9478971.1 response regulator [Nitrospira sp.]
MSEIEQENRHSADKCLDTNEVEIVRGENFNGIPLFLLQRKLESMHPLRTILLVDDNVDDCDLVNEAWKETLVCPEFRCVHDGTELLAYLHRKGEFSDRERAPLPSVILLDLHMPHMMGHETLARIKDEPSFSRIPIIVLTTSKAPRDIQRSATLGVHGYIQKPNTFSGYLQLLTNLQQNWQEILDRPFSGHSNGGWSGNPAYC